MPNRVPSLQSLLILDAAVKHGNFTRAARALSLTHSAVSQQIQALERRLRVRLFRREGQGMRPTPACLALAGEVRQAIALLDRAFSTTRSGTNESHLIVSVLPHFATGWLIARLPRFCSSERGMVVDLLGSHVMDDPDDRSVDASIRFGPGNWPGLSAERLAGETAFPVCAPSYLKKIQPLERMPSSALLRSPFPPWEPWLQATGLRLETPASGTFYGDPLLLLSAAREGQGVGMARRLIVADDLRYGRLVRPYKQSAREPFAYYLVWRPDSPKKKLIRAFAGWLKAELSATK